MPHLLSRRLRNICLFSFAISLGFLASGCGGSGKPAPLPNFVPVYTFGDSLEINRPAILPNGDVYTVKGDETGTYLVKYTDFGKGAVTQVPFPSGQFPFDGYIAVSPTTGNIYGSLYGQVLMFTSKMQYVKALPQTAVVIGGYPYNEPYAQGIVIDSKGNVWVLGGTEIFEYDANGNFLTKIDPELDQGYEGRKLAIDSSDNLYVGYTFFIDKISLSGQILKRISCDNATADSSIAVDGKGNIYTAAVNNGKLGRYSPDGKLTAISSGSQGVYITVDASGHVYNAGTQITVLRASDMPQ